MGTLSNEIHKASQDSESCLIRLMPQTTSLLISFVTYGTFACETSSSFVADSRRPQKTLLGLKIAAWLMLPIYVGGSWVVMRLAINPELKDSAFLNLLAASEPFWGKSAGLIITFLLAASCLLACATVVSNCPRILYQMAYDKYLSPVFGVVSHRGVFGSGLTLTLVLSLTCLIWGNVAEFKYRLLKRSLPPVFLFPLCAFRKRSFLLRKRCSIGYVGVLKDWLIRAVAATLHEFGECQEIPCQYNDFFVNATVEPFS